MHQKCKKVIINNIANKEIKNNEKNVNFVNF